MIPPRAWSAPVVTAVLQVVVPVVGLAVWQATRGGGGGGGDQAGASPGAPLMSTVIMTVGSAAISLAGLAFAGAALHPLWSSRHWTTATATVPAAARPIAVRTWLVLRLPDEQALPWLSAMPAASKMPASACGYGVGKEIAIFRGQRRHPVPPVKV